MLQEAADVGQGRSEGGSRRRRQRGLIGGGGAERSGRRRGVCVCVCAVGVDRRVAYVFLGGAGDCEAMQCNAGDLAWAM